jgi:hypothetical protein
VPFDLVEQAAAQQHVARGAARIAVTLGQAPLVDPEAARVDQPGAQVGDDLRFGEGEPSAAQVDDPAGIAADLEGAGGLPPGEFGQLVGDQRGRMPLYRVQPNSRPSPTSGSRPWVTRRSRSAVRRPT